MNLAWVERDQRHRRTLTPALSVVVTTGLFIIIGISNLGQASYWWDEVFSVAFAELEWSQLWGLLATHEGNMCLYFILLKIWIALGDGEFTVRLLSFAFATASIPLIFLLGRRLFGATEGAAAALLLACSSFFMIHAQEARGYSLLVMLVIAASYLFVRFVETPSVLTAAAYAVVAGLALYAHFFAGFVIAVQAAFSAALLRRRPDVRWAISAYAAIALIGLPLIAFIAFRGTDQISWIPAPKAWDVVHIMTSLAGGSKLLVLAYFVASFPVLLRLRHVTFDRSSNWWRLAFVVAWLFAPIVSAFLISVTLTPMFIDRYLIVCLPALVLIAAVGLSTIHPRYLAVIVVSALALFSARQLALMHSSLGAEDWRDAAAYVLKEAQRDDGLVFFRTDARIPFGFYERQGSASNVPQELAADFDAGSLSRPGSSSAIACAVVCRPVNDWGNANWSGAQRIWLVLAHNNISEGDERATAEIRSRLAARDRLLEHRVFGGVTVELYSPGNALSMSTH